MELTLAREMFDEITLAARECNCTPRQFAIECVEAILAERRLPKVTPAPYGAQMRGTRWTGNEHEDAEAADDYEERDVELLEHKILL
jgi:hypothetical protein